MTRSEDLARTLTQTLVNMYDLCIKEDGEVVDIISETIINYNKETEYPPDHIRIASAEYYKRGHPAKAVRLTNRFSKMNFKQSKIYCDEHYK